jgi:Holliday junction resolvase RusA-like endonuclease
MKKVLYKRFDGAFYTSGSQAWKKKEKKNHVLDFQRKKLRELVAGFQPSLFKKYHLRAIFHLRSARIGSDLDNMLKEFSDTVFGKHRDQRIYSVNAQKVSDSRESIRFWIYELS